MKNFSENNINSSKNIILVFMILFTMVLLSRWASHLWNFTLVGGAFLFAGAYFQDKKISIALMLSTMLVSDYAIGFHSQMPSVYLAYLILVALGFSLKINSGRNKVLGFSVLGSFLFYLITNFSVWLQGSLYPVTFSGLIDCYIMGIPFYRNQLLSDVLSSFAFFEVARLVSKLVSLPAASEPSISEIKLKK